MTAVYDCVSPASPMGLLPPVAMVRVEIYEPIADVLVEEEYNSALALVCADGVPIGQLALPVHGGRCTAREIQTGIIETLGREAFERWADSRLAGPVKDPGLEMEEVLSPPEPPHNENVPPPMTVVVCTRDRPGHLYRCLEALQSVDYPDFEVIVVDNAPTSDDTRTLVETNFPRMRYVLEPQPGLSRARNAGVAQARGEIVAFTDDDAVADRNWLRAIAGVFSASDDVAVVTGLVLPRQLDTDSQLLLETHWSYTRGFERTWFRGTPAVQPGQVQAYGYGAGVNMAVDRRWLADSGGFDVNLGAGTAAGSGEDMDVFFRALMSRRLLVYEPAAIVAHVHRRTREQLETQVYAWSAGYGAYLRKALHAYPEVRSSVLKYICLNLLGQVGQLMAIHLVPSPAPRGILRTQFVNSIRHLLAHKPDPGTANVRYSGVSTKRRRPDRMSTATRIVDLCEGIPDIRDTADFDVTTIFVRIGSRLVGMFSIVNGGTSIPAIELRDNIVRKVGISLMTACLHSSNEQVEARLLERVRAATEPLESTASMSFDAGSSTEETMISTIIATRGRPEQLRRCLRSLVCQVSPPRHEIIVVDNNESFDRASPLVREFPAVKWLHEPTAGTSPARNAGYAASRGNIIALIDDDVIVPPHWLLKIASAFNRRDIFVVTGNILPLALETPAQRMFERYLSHGRGFEQRIVGPGFFTERRFRAVPVWALGTSANLAFRRDIVFARENGAIMERILGPGTPTAAGEDLYFLYRTAQEGYTIKYDPDTYVFHEHRSTMRQLYRQVYNYGKGHYSFQTLTLMRHGDLRALLHMTANHPWIHLKRIFGARDYPLTLTAAEALGNLCGPLSLLLSWLKRDGAVRIAEQTSRSENAEQKTGL